jgi:hypothetical protein
MERLGHIARVNVQDCHCIFEVVLVDKSPGRPRAYPDADIAKRYRLTLDLKPLNKLRVEVVNGVRQFVPQDQSSAEEEEVSEAQKQFQIGALELLRTTVLTTKRFFVKIDLSNAFNSIAIHELLGRFMNTQATDRNGHPVYFSWRCLPQGFRLSPLLFSYAMRFILSKARLHEVVWAYFQDDIVLGGDTKEEVESAVISLRELFESYGFSLNADKISAVSISCIFCGYRVGFGTVAPEAKNKTGFESMWSIFESAWARRDKDGMLSWLRSQLGRIQYCARWLSANAQVELSSQYRYIKLFQDSKFTFATLTDSVKADIRSTMQKLMEAAGTSLNPLYSKMVDVRTFKGTVIVTDANRRAWCGMIFRILIGDETEDANAPPDELLSQLLELPDIKHLGFDRACKLVTLGFYGKCWSTVESRKSSTQLERLAQLYTVDQGREHLFYPVILVNDNQNTVKEWRKVEETFGAHEVHQWHYLTSQVTYSVWLPRDCMICNLADIGARMIEKEVIECNAIGADQLNRG